MRKNAFTFWDAIVVLVFLAIAAAILFPVFGRARQYDGVPRGCGANLKAIALAVKQYTQDYDAKFPLVNSGHEGWSNNLYPYLRDTQRFQCPSEAKGNQFGTTDYFYNARLAGLETRKLASAFNTIMNGDGAGNAPSNSSLTAFPQDWANAAKSPANRHLDGANYAYADGHMKWLKSSSVTSKEAAPYISTFSPW